MNPLRRLIHEIHRRSLWQVLAVYVVGAWVGYQVILDLVEGLGLPEWLPGFAVVLFVIGLPVVVATAMVQEGPPGVTRADPTLLPGSGLEDAPAPAPVEPTAAHRIFTWRNAIAGGIGAFALWGVVAAVLAFGTVSSGGGEGPPIERLSGDAGTLTVTSEPEGARLRITPLDDAGPATSRIMDAGETPVQKRRISPGAYLLTLDAPDHHSTTLLLEVAARGASVLAPRLTPERAPAGMLLVPAGPAPGGGEAADFLMDQTEVTNARFADFVAAGGYQDARLWPDTMWVDGEHRPRDAALAKFVDRTGHSAPRGWSGGLPPAGRSDHPVVGVSWYEAAAYARWAGRALPSWSQWWRAALGDGSRHFPWGDDPDERGARANFGLLGTTPVGSFPLGLSPFGLADMAGNVREWLLHAPPDGPAERRQVVGGGWADPLYMFEASHAEAFPPDFAADHLGFRTVAAPPPT